jgi:hypothetical protein
VVGTTYSSNFAGMSSSAIQKARNGESDGFIVKIDPLGSKIVYATYLGGSANDGVDGVAVGTQGNAIVAGYTTSANFPGTAGSRLQPTNHGKTDGFVAAIDPAGSAIVYSTYLGGSGDDYVDAVAIDSLGSPYVSGYTESLNFPGTSASPIQASYAGEGDGFVAELTPIGDAIVYSTYLGGANYDEAYTIAVHSRSAYVGGATLSLNFNGASASPIQSTNKGDYDGFVARISAVDVAPRSAVVPVEAPVPADVGRP